MLSSFNVFVWFSPFLSKIVLIKRNRSSYDVSRGQYKIDFYGVFLIGIYKLRIKNPKRKIRQSSLVPMTHK